MNIIETRFAAVSLFAALVVAGHEALAVRELEQPALKNPLCNEVVALDDIVDEHQLTAIPNGEQSGELLCPGGNSYPSKPAIVKY